MVTERNSVRLAFKEGINPDAKIILVDQDGVLADFEGEFLRRWQKKYPDLPYVPYEQRSSFYLYDDYPKELRRQIEDIYFARGFFGSLPPIDGALEAIKAMKKEGYIVKICTSPLTGNKDCLTEKHNWIEKHLGKEWIRDLIISSDKTLVYGDYLIDDKPDIHGTLVPSWEHIVFDTPYNRSVNNGKRRINNWHQWKKILE